MTAAPPFSAVVTLDGITYTLTTRWFFYSERWYYQLTNQSGVILIFAPLIDSVAGSPIPLAPYLFTTSTLVYYSDTQTFVVT